jgi:hypothetical protein
MTLVLSLVSFVIDEFCVVPLEPVFDEEPLLVPLDEVLLAEVVVLPAFSLSFAIPIRFCFRSNTV